MTQTYYGTKKIEAKPMSRGEYNAYRGWQLPKDENGADEGYLVEYLDGESPANLAHHHGYVSWSPKGTFEHSYKPTTAMSFGHAVMALEEGSQVARVGWNGKGMYLELQVPDKNSKMSLPYIYMKTACNNLVPWLASQTDILAKDWMIVD